MAHGVVSPAKTAEPIEMPFGLSTRVGPGYHVLNRGPDTHGKGQFWVGKGRPIVKYRDTVRSSEQNGRTDRDTVWVMGLDGPQKSLLLKKTWQFKMVCKDDSGCSTQLKQQKSKRWYYLSAHWLSGDVLLSFFFRSSGSLPLTLFYRLSGEVTENTFLSVKKTKLVAYCGNFWSRSLARFMRAAQFESVSSCARRLLKHFRCKSLQIIWDTDDR